MLDIEDCRKVFAERITALADEGKSFERALMAACEYAYRRGLDDGREDAERPDFVELNLSFDAQPELIREIQNLIGGRIVKS